MLQATERNTESDLTNVHRGALLQAFREQKSITSSVALVVHHTACSPTVLLTGCNTKRIAKWALPSKSSMICQLPPKQAKVCLCHSFFSPKVIFNSPFRWALHCLTGQPFYFSFTSTCWLYALQQHLFYSLSMNANLHPYSLCPKQSVFTSFGDFFTPFGDVNHLWLSCKWTEGCYWGMVTYVVPSV